MSDKSDNRKMNLLAGCVLPLAQAAITGVLVFLVTLGIAILMAWPKVWLISGVVGGAAAMSTWLYLQDVWRRHTYPFEDDDNGQRYETSTTLMITLDDRDGASEGIFCDVPIDRERLAVLANGLIAGATLAETTWTGPGRPFTRAEFAQVRAALIARGLASWRNSNCPARGCDLTRPGRAAMKWLATTPE
jgi:hypothetical protein